MSALRMLPPSGVRLGIGDIAKALLAARREGGGVVDRFRAEIRERFGICHVFLYSSGRAGLSATFQALRALHPDRDEILLPGWTSYSVPSAAAHAGFKVRLYDLDPETMCPDPASFEAGLTDRTLCAVVCHLFGYPCRMDRLASLCADRGVALLDDAAQAMGAELDGRAAGTMGDAGLYSLSRGKNITAVDGGVVVTDRDDLAAELSRLETASHPRLAGLLVKALIIALFLHPRLYWLPASLPFLGIGRSVFDPEFDLADLSPFQAALGSLMLARLGRINDGRARKARRFLDVLHETVRSMQSTERSVRPPVHFIRSEEGAEPVYLRLPVVAEGFRPDPELGVVRSYPQALSRLEELKPHLAAPAACPGAERLAEAVLTLPTHEHVAEKDVAAIRKYLTSN